MVAHSIARYRTRQCALPFHASSWCWLRGICWPYIMFRLNPSAVTLEDSTRSHDAWAKRIAILRADAEAYRAACRVAAHLLCLLCEAVKNAAMRSLSVLSCALIFADAVLINRVTSTHHIPAR